MLSQKYLFFIFLVMPYFFTKYEGFSHRRLIVTTPILILYILCRNLITLVKFKDVFWSY